MFNEYFEEAVRNKDVEAVRIQLKNNLLFYSGGSEFKNMLRYAKENVPGLMEPYDGGPIYPLEKKWNSKMLSNELAALMENYSDERIENLSEKLQRIERQKERQRRRQEIEKKRVDSKSKEKSSLLGLINKKRGK